MYRQQNMLQVPLFGNMTKEEIEENIRKAIIDEATAADFYSRLLSQAPDKLHYDYIAHARDDEIKHLNYFEKLYYQLFGKNLQYRVEPLKYSGYKEGLLIALDGELEAGEFYRDMQLSVKDPLIREVFYFPMVDELEHATRFSTLLNQLV